MKLPFWIVLVTWTTIAAEALNILRENKDEYHIVITDIKRLDIDGFKLLEIIGLEMDLPVICMFETSLTVINLFFITWIYLY